MPRPERLIMTNRLPMATTGHVRAVYRSPIVLSTLRSIFWSAAPGRVTQAGNLVATAPTNFFDEPPGYRREKMKLTICPREDMAIAPVNAPGWACIGRMPVSALIPLPFDREAASPLFDLVEEQEC
jgi:hypothetical protein